MLLSVDIHGNIFTPADHRETGLSIWLGGDLPTNRRQLQGNEEIMLLIADASLAISAITRPHFRSAVGSSSRDAVGGLEGQWIKNTTSESSEANMTNQSDQTWRKW
jgi:hypothetical protein